MTTKSKSMLSLLAFAAVSFSLRAQKLPKVQKSSVNAPADIKIDGRTTEWNNGFQAYNKATNIYYTMANDSSQLFLVIHVTDFFTMQKLLQGGITLSIFSNDKKLNPGIAAITFPLVSQGVAGGALSRIKDTSVNMKTQLSTINNQLISNIKEIRVTGVNEITDTLISVYNELGIKAVIAFDTNRELSYELSVPLKYLKKWINNSGEFKYDIKVNSISRSMQIMMGDREIDPASPEGRQIMAQLSNPSNQNIIGIMSGSGFTQATGSFAEMMSATNFTATYTLAK